VAGTNFTKVLASIALANLEFEERAFDFTEDTLKKENLYAIESMGVAATSRRRPPDVTAEEQGPAARDPPFRCRFPAAVHL
jgi:hypothetical protein